MNENLIVREVKQIIRHDFKETGIERDITKLIEFVEEAYYFRGILFIYILMISMNSHRFY